VDTAVPELQQGVVMLKALSAAAIVALTAGGAFAADMSVKAPIAPNQFTWAGCFAGVRAGAAISDDKIRSSSDFNSTGFIGGGQIGCDYQFASAVVMGIEGRAAWSNLVSDTPGRGNNGAGIIFPTHFTVANDFLASATARLGYAVSGNWLFYVRGGAAWTREKSDIVFTPPGLGLAVDPRGNATRTGWTAGTGVDWAFAPHWSTSLEYDYYDFGANDFFLTDPVSGVTFHGNLKDRIHTVTVGLNYHF
jgi:outer membrane immunogenic protein